MHIVKTIVTAIRQHFLNRNSLSPLLTAASQLPFNQILFMVNLSPEMRNSQGKAVIADIAFFLFFFPPCSEKNAFIFYLCI